MILECCRSKIILWGDAKAESWSDGIFIPGGRSMRVRTPLLCACVFLAIGGSRSFAQSSASATTAQRTDKMERVTGIGGLFFRAADPKGLAEWYERHLGVTQTPTSYDEEPWRQEEGWTAFAPFATDTKYFGRPTQQWMINFRVRDLDAMVAQLTRAGIAVDVNRETYPNGRFARLLDPEGNPIELWEPKHSSNSAISR
jgi:predicted enzyme related to lactoylglutathione lyase